MLAVCSPALAELSTDIVSVVAGRCRAGRSPVAVVDEAMGNLWSRAGGVEGGQQWGPTQWPMVQWVKGRR